MCLFMCFHVFFHFFCSICLHCISLTERYKLVPRCDGCAQTSYVKLMTQLFGPRMMIANATGCSSVWGSLFAVNPYTTDGQGRGPAFARSLFEDAAEFGFGMLEATNRRRANLLAQAGRLPRHGNAVTRLHPHRLAIWPGEFCTPAGQIGPTGSWTASKSFVFGGAKVGENELASPNLGTKEIALHNPNSNGY